MEHFEVLKPFVVPRSSASRMLMKIETNGHAPHTGKSAAGRKRVKRREPNRSALLSSTSNKIGVSVHFLAKKQKQILCPSKFERGSQLGTYIRGQKSPKASVRQKIRLQEDASVRLHVKRCAQTGVWAFSRMVTYYTFFNIGCLEIPGCGLNQMEMLQMK